MVPIAWLRRGCCVLERQGYRLEKVSDPAGRHLGFGYGVHQCLEENLARAEMQIAVTALARRLPALRLAVAVEDLKYHNERDLRHP